MKGLPNVVFDDMDHFYKVMTSAVEISEIMAIMWRIESQLKNLLPKHTIKCSVATAKTDHEIDLIIKRSDGSILYEGKHEGVEEALLYFPPIPGPFHFQILEADKNRLLVWRVMGA
jgi:hypothetical protein